MLKQQNLYKRVSKGYPKGINTLQEQEQEKDKDKDKDKDKESRFKKPTLDQVSQYCKERGNNIDAEYFWDSNESKGWVVGKLKTPMKDWKAVIRTWERNDKKDESKKMDMWG